MPSFNEKTVHLDLDAIVAPKAVTIQLNGTVHAVVEASVETYIENTRDIQALSLASDMLAEVEMSVRMIRRSIPTLPEAEIRALTFSQIQAIMNFTRAASGEAAVEAQISQEATKTENPPTGE